MDDVTLRKVGEQEQEVNTLPRGVYAVAIGNRIVFVRRTPGRFVPVSAEEQKTLETKHIVS